MSRPARIRNGFNADSCYSQAARSAPKREPRFLPRGMSRIEAADYIGVSPSLLAAIMQRFERFSSLPSAFA
jgi:hypothetical protein